jgi:hypothetical protein
LVALFKSGVNSGFAGGFGRPTNGALADGVLRGAYLAVRPRTALTRSSLPSGAKNEGISEKSRLRVALVLSTTSVWGVLRKLCAIVATIGALGIGVQNVKLPEHEEWGGRKGKSSGSEHALKMVGEK